MVKKYGWALGCCLVLVGCQAPVGNVGRLSTYPVATTEAGWIRNGEPIEFEDGFWYPVDKVEGLLDSEMYLLGEHRGVQFFVEKTDVRPYNRLYTKFGHNKFRVFENQKRK